MRLVSTTTLSPRRPLGIIVDGDSITFGAIVPTFYRYADVGLRSVPSSLVGSYSNIAISGETLSAMVANLATAVYPKITAAHSAGQLALCYCAGGTNDIGGGSPATAAQVFALATTYFQGCKSNGADICMAWTLTPKQVVPDPGDSTRLTYNNMLRANYKSIGIDILIDVGADPQVGTQAGASLTQIYGDHLHPTILGNDIMANYFATGISSIGSAVSISAVSVSSGPVAGGTSVDIQGVGFLGTNRVALAGMSTLTPLVLSDTLVRVVSQSSYVAGSGDVMVMGSQGSARLALGWTYT